MNGNRAIVESNEGVQYKRNVTHLKKFYEKECTSMSDESPLIENEIFDEKCETKLDADVGCNPESESNTEPISVSNDTGNENVSVKSSPVRNKKLPSRFQGFSMY